MSISRGLCIEQKLSLHSGVGSADAVVRKMLLTGVSGYYGFNKTNLEARVVIVLLGEGNWLKLMKAFRSEMVCSFSPNQFYSRIQVIAGRFILFSIQDPRWQSAKVKF